MKRKKIFLYAISVILSPIIFSTFVMDRIILALFPWVRIQTIRDWAVNDKEISYSFVRVFLFILLGLLIYWLL